MKKIGWITLLSCFFAFIFSITGETKVLAAFNDLPAGHYAEKEINYLVKQDIIKGIGNGKFGTNQNVKRAEAAAMMVRAKKMPVSGHPTFLDAKNHNLSKEIAAAENYHIINGYPDGTFRPDDPITRAEAAVMMSRAFSFQNAGTAVTFLDIANSFARDQIRQAASAGYLAGYPNGEFRPNQNMTRAEFAVIIARGLDANFRIDPKPSRIIASKLVTASTLNVRRGPSTSYPVLGKLNNGAQIDIYSISGNWAEIRFNGQWGYVHTDYLANPGSVLKNRIIVVDAGHGGNDPGAVANGLKEKDINLDTAKRLETKLKAKGASVVMTRSTDSYLSLSERVNAAYRANGHAFVSIHSNAASESASGTETYYYSASVTTQSVDEVRKESEKLAKAIQNRLIEKLGMRDRGTKHGNFYVIRENTRMPSALVELGFVTNKDDVKKLGSASWRDQAAEAIALGIEDYFKGK